MASIHRKISKKLNPKPKTTSPPPEKVGKDYWLIGILVLTVIFMVGGWSHFDNINRGLYIALIVSLGSTYARRHAKVTPSQEELIERVGLGAMALATVLFIAEIYYKFIA